MKKTGLQRKQIKNRTLNSFVLGVFTINWTQKTLSERSGVSYGTLKKFERSGQISLESLLKLAVVLGELESFERVLTTHVNTLPSSIDELLKDKTRKRGRQ